MKRVLKFFGNGEELETRIRNIKPNANDFYVVSNCLDNAVFFENIDKNDFYDICDALEDGLYNDKDASLAETLAEYLKANSLTLSTAESCTGGLIAAAIVGVDGASAVFKEGLVTYSNEAKENRLFVKHDTLMEFGAVSSQTAREMAVGLLDGSVDVGVSVTGIAGPSGGTDQKPVGTVHIGVALQGREPVTFAFLFSGAREQIRNQSKNAALFYTLYQLKNNL